jgi:hypothetical protein
LKRIEIGVMSVLAPEGLVPCICLGQVHEQSIGKKSFGPSGILQRSPTFQQTELISCDHRPDVAGKSHSPKIPSNSKAHMTRMRPIFTKIGGINLGGIPDTPPKGQLLM